MKYTFPQYRKYTNNKSAFKISSLDEFEEIQVLGCNKMKMTFEAKTFVDRNLIQDMLDCESNRWVIISEMEYSEF